MAQILEIKCPNCGATLTKTENGGFHCDYCESDFALESDLEEQMAYAREKGRIKAQEERFRQAAAERHKKQVQLDKENTRKKNAAELIGGIIMLISLVLLFMYKYSGTPGFAAGALLTWIIAAIFGFIEYVNAKVQKRKSGVGVIIAMMAIHLFVLFFIRGK